MTRFNLIMWQIMVFFSIGVIQVSKLGCLPVKIFSISELWTKKILILLKALYYRKIHWVYSHCSQLQLVLELVATSSNWSCCFLLYAKPKREAIRKATPLSIAGSENDQPAKTSTTVKEPVRVFINQNQTLPPVILKADRSSLITELDWDIDLEYDPMHPSDYDKIARGGAPGISTF